MMTTRPSSVTRQLAVSCVYSDACALRGIWRSPLLHLNKLHNKVLLLSYAVAESTGAAAFFAMREYEKHQAANGQPPSHEFAKELMAGVAGAEASFCHQHIFLHYTELLLMIHSCGDSCLVMH